MSYASWSCMFAFRLSLIAGALMALQIMPACAEPHRLTLEVLEPIGVHRDGSPVHALLVLPRPVAASTSFRLLQDGRPVVAQFRPDSNSSETSKWWLDFIAQSAPNERCEYVVEYGTDVEAGPERTRGHQLIARDDCFVVSNAPYIDWTIPRDFRGFLRSVEFTPSEHLRPNSIGLTIRDREGNTHQLGGDGTNSRIVREGKMAVALRFEKTETGDALRGIQWTADLIFPGSVSWVDMRLNIDDPENRVGEVGLQLSLNLNQPSGNSRTLVELGAARTVYRSLLGNGKVELRADADNASPWQVLRGVEGELHPFVVAAEHSSPAEGWAHVMDRERCLAIAFEDFGRQGEERLNISGEGTLTATKRFAAAPSRGGVARKRWRMWLHFVQFPPAQSAATDPQMMQNPLIVRQVER
ncbi:MAG: hypothetical protein HYV60_07180 [Planctomycetia bacterium]|nr:hypothetical protein [Planctomycetia bacterium]